MNENKVTFVAHINQENLGIGYLSSMLISQGYDILIIDFGLEDSIILEQIKEADSMIVGFSLIFQYNLFRLKELVEFLRNNGIYSHFTVGGHYPSLRYDDLLEHIPEIDSVVRFEGEHTICELANRIKIREDWRSISGIAFIEDSTPHSNELRPLIQDLDTLPFPYRPKLRTYECMNKNISFLLASRGCIRNCSFCSVRKFYSTPPGKLRRFRSPNNVILEMKDLYEKSDISIFLFQDDDFVLPGKKGQEWINNFITLLKEQQFSNKILWKINCRSDEVSSDLFESMKEVGLSTVYLGIESGIDEELEIFNKKLTAEDHINAVKILEDLDLTLEYGFMLFNPYSTFEKVNENISFLKKVSRITDTPVVFCKMIPYAETKIENLLLAENRLKSSVINPDYDFLDPILEEFHKSVYKIFRKWMHTNEGVLSRLRYHRLEIEVLKKFYPNAVGLQEYIAFQKKITSDFNSLFFETFEKTMSIFQKEDPVSISFQNEIHYKLVLNIQRITEKWHDGIDEFQNKNRI